MAIQAGTSEHAFFEQTQGEEGDDGLEERGEETVENPS